MNVYDPIVVSGPWPGVALRVVELHWRAALGKLDTIELRLVAERPDLDGAQALGRSVTVKYLDHTGRPQALHGEAIRVSRAGTVHTRAAYAVTVRPRAWRLARSSHCRVFQGQRLPAIVEGIVGAQAEGWVHHRLRSAEFPARDLCVQYRETDLDFMLRLLEREGVTANVEHGETAATLSLVDDPAAEAASREPVSLRVVTEVDHRPELETVHDLHIEDRVVTTGVVAVGYDFKLPHRPVAGRAAPGTASLTSPVPHGETWREHEGHLVDDTSAERRARLRQEALAAEELILTGITNARRLAPGCVVRLERHDGVHAGRVWLVTDVEVDACQPAGDASSSDHRWQCRFRAVPVDRPYRPPVRTQWPVAPGPQTARVVGPQGAEIHTDAHGRVQLRLQWELTMSYPGFARTTADDGLLTGWVRVAQGWAGRGFGAMQIPRVGEEVVVDFLDGDLDRPMVVGRVHNAENPHPWDPDQYRQISGLRTRLTPDGGAMGHLLGFDDNRCAPRVMLHAERLLQVKVTGDRVTALDGHDRLQVGRDRHIQVDGADALTAQKSVTVTCGRARLTMQADGSIELQGTRLVVRIDGTGLIRAEQGLTLSGPNKTLNL